MRSCDWERLLLSILSASGAKTRKGSRCCGTFALGLNISNFFNNAPSTGFAGFLLFIYSKAFFFQFVEISELTFSFSDHEQLLSMVMDPERISLIRLQVYIFVLCQTQSRQHAGVTTASCRHGISPGGTSHAEAVASSARFVTSNFFDAIYTLGQGITPTMPAIDFRSIPHIPVTWIRWSAAIRISMWYRFQRFWPQTLWRWEVPTQIIWLFKLPIRWKWRGPTSIGASFTI